MRAGVKTTAPDQRRQIQAAIEIKGSIGLQRIDLGIQPDWRPIDQLIHWQSIGAIKEVVVLVNSNNVHQPVTGTILIDVRFQQLSDLRRLSLSQMVRFTSCRSRRYGSCVPCATTTWCLFGSAIAVQLAEWNSEDQREQFPTGRRSTLRLLLRDLIQGMGVAMIALLVIETYLLGARGRLETGWTALGLAIAGAAVAEWWKVGLTGKHLTGLEVFQNVLASGLIATSASSLAILQAPASWSDLLLLSQPVAAAGMLIYHTVNAYPAIDCTPAPALDECPADCRDTLRHRGFGPAGVGEPDAVAGKCSHGRISHLHSLRRWNSSGASWSFSASTRQ